MVRCSIYLYIFYFTFSVFVVYHVFLIYLHHLLLHILFKYINSLFIYENVLFFQVSLDSDFQDAIDVIQRDADHLYHDAGKYTRHYAKYILNTYFFFV